MHGYKASLLMLAALAVIGGCARGGPKPSVELATPEPVAGGDWRVIASPEHRQQIEGLASLWDEALGKARKAGFATRLSAEGDLLRPDAALGQPAPTPGSYRCRTVKLGGSARANAYLSFKPFYCYVDADGAMLTFVKQTGSQRPAGRLWSEDERRLVFLGALARSAADTPAYGDDTAQSVVGVFERIAPFRWRMVVPSAGGGSSLDVIELIPVVQQAAAN